MKIVDKYVYPKSSRANIAGLRHYTVDGEEQNSHQSPLFLDKHNQKKSKRVLSDGAVESDCAKLKKLQRCCHKRDSNA